MRAHVVGLAMLSVLGVVGCGGGSGGPASAEPPETRPTSPAPEVTRVASVDKLTVAGEPAVIATPTSGTTQRAVIYAHGYSQNAMAILGQPIRQTIAARLLAAGYVVAASDAHGDAWGNNASVDAYLALRDELVRRGARRVFMLAESMGGLASLRLVDRVDAWAGIYPVCNLASLDADPQFKRSIADAYTGTTSAPLRVGRKGLPMAFWASPRDQLVSSTANTERCAREARRRGARATVHETRGDHGDASNWNGAALVEFFDAVE